MLAKEKWIELLDRKKLEIIEKLTEAYIDAFNTRKCIAVELFDDGRVEFALFPSKEDMHGKYEYEDHILRIGEVDGEMAYLPDDFIPVDEDGKVNAEGITADQVIEMDGEDFAQEAYQETLRFLEGEQE